MEQIIVTHPDGSQTPLISKDTSVVTKAEQTVSLLAEDVVNISVSSVTPIQFILGDTVEVYGKTYTLNQLPAVKKTGERRFTYDLVFEGVQYELLDAQFLLPDNTVGDSFTGNLFTFVQILASNANRVFPGKWTVGEYPAETEYKTLTFSGENCLAVLQRICEEWQQEFEIAQTDGTRLLHIRNAGQNFPYTFRYGLTGGLYELTRKNIDSQNVVTRLYCYGGSNNIPNSYLTDRGSTKLCLPEKNKNTSYIQDSAAVAAFGIKENTKTFDDIFPNRYGEVTAKGSKYNAFVDNTMSFDLNEKDSQGNTLWLVAGVSAKVHFNTGNLAGYEFDVHKYDHATKTIELVPFTDESGMEFPSKTSAAFQFAATDKYFFIDINLPTAYIDEAESKLSEAGQEYYLQNSQPRVQYGLNIDENFIRQFAGNLTVVNLFAVADYIPVEDTDIGVDKSVRITGFTRDLLKIYKYSLTLGDSVTKTTLTRLIAEQKSIDRIIEINNLNDPAKARRNWRASQEVLAMVFDPEGDYYSEKIKPASIETAMLQVGAKSMQFVLQNVIFEPNYDGNPNNIRVSAGSLIHYTVEETIRNWTIAATEVNSLVSNTAYYIYARCQTVGNAGNIILDTAQRTVDYEANYYTFWVGVLNSVTTDDGGLRPARLISLTYGSTTVNGRFIKTGRIESSGGSGSFFDLDNNQFRIGDTNTGLSWNINSDGKLVLKGTMVQSQSGDEQPIGCFRGAYNNSYTYYKGDEITYNGSTYRYINNTASNSAPTNTAYWSIIAEKGTDGAYFEYRYRAGGSATTPPALTTTDVSPSGWETYLPGGYVGYVWMTVAKKDEAGTTLLQNWSPPIRLSGDTGAKGDSPAPVYRGDYSSTATYYGMSTRVDIVKYNGTYYIARTDAGNGFTNKIPTNTDYWNTFGAQFESIATQLLLAENANIAGWIFRNNRLETQDGGMYLDGSGGIVKGYMVNPYIDLGTLSADVTLNLLNGFNYTARGIFGSGKKTIYLPNNIMYNGVICLIYSPRFTQNDIGVRVQITGGGSFSYPTGSLSTVSGIDVLGRKLKLEAMPNLAGTAVIWYIDNYFDFDSDDFITS